MAIHLYQRCPCTHHQYLTFIREEANDEAPLPLRKLGTPCSMMKNTKTTLLHHAMHYNKTRIVQPLIDYGCNVNAKDISGRTPLMLAIQDSNLTAVEILLKNDADVYVSNSSEENSLQIACLKLYDYAPPNLNESVELAVLRKMFEKVNSDFYKDQKATTQLILKAQNAVKLAVVANADVELAKIVLKDGFPLSFFESRCGFTALHVAIMYQNIANVLLLLEHDADVDVQDYYNRSALFCYLYNYQEVDKNSKVLEDLLSRTEGLHLSNETRVSDFEHFLMYGNENTVRTVLRKALQSRIDISAMEFQGGKSLLHILTASDKDPDVCNILDELSIQYDVNARDANECTALTVALRSGRYGAVDTLLKRGAKVTMTERDSQDLLDAVDLLHSDSTEIEDHIPNIVAILLEYGVDVQCVFQDGKSLIKRLCYERGEMGLNIGEKMIIAHLALLAKIKDSALTDRTREDIESEKLFKDYFNFCAKQLEKLKKVKVRGNVTLLNLLTKDQEQITAYARDEKFTSALESTMQKNSHLERYYSIILNRRVAKAIDASRFEIKLTRIIENFMGVSSDAYFFITHKIISYLSYQDKYNLSKVEGVLYEKK